MKRVKRSYCEVPFVVTVEGKPVTGKIERLCEMEDGSWVVIDYKSEATSPYDYITIAKEYKDSMTSYVKAAGQFVGEKSVMGWLYFIEPGMFWDSVI